MVKPGTLPPMPKLRHGSHPTTTRNLTITTNVFKKPGGWGGTDPGRWFEALGSTAVGGTCARCQTTARAVDLKVIEKRREGTFEWVHADRSQCGLE